jgi:hypothetical protein
MIIDIPVPKRKSGIDIDVPDGKSRDWEVSTFTVEADDPSQVISAFKTGRYVPAGTYKRLTRKGQVIMSNTPDEIRDCSEFIREAKGKILINGLGLGVILKAILNKPEVEDVTIIEFSEDVIKLVAPTYIDKRVNIIQASAFDYQPPKNIRYDCVWHDIWDDMCSDNLKEMATLHRKYGRRTNWQGSWGKEYIQYHLRRFGW